MKKRTLENIKRNLETLETFELDVDTFYNRAEQELNQSKASKNKMVSIYQELLDEVSQKMNQMDRHMGMTPNCQMGCAFCCYFPIIVTRLEAKLIIESINAMDFERQQKIKRHLKDYFNKYDQLVTEATGLDFEQEKIKYEYVKKQLPCPLLNTETNTCMAYEARPLPCRTYVNYMDPKICEENLMPEEAVSFEFLYEDYMGALNESAQVITEEDDQSFMDYPTDVYQYNYLPVFLREWILEQ